MKLFLFVILTCVSLGTQARAQNLDGTPLAACPGYTAYHPAVSQINWSVNCFLKAILDQDKRLAAAIAPDTACSMGREFCVDGIIDEIGNNFFLGASGGNSFHRLTAGAKSIVVSYSQSPGGLEVIFAISPEKGVVNFANAWMEDFFVCHFSFDGQLDVWLVDDFCYTDMGGIDENAVVDLSGVSGDHLPMLWTPKNAGR